MYNNILNNTTPQFSKTDCHLVKKKLGGENDNLKYM